MDWSRRGRVSRLGTCVTVLGLLASAMGGCTSGSPGSAGPDAGCGSAPGTASGPLPFNLIDVSGVPGTHQAWVLAGQYSDPLQAGNYLLHVSGSNWAMSAKFGPDIHLAGVSAVSASAAWVVPFPQSETMASPRSPCPRGAPGRSWAA